MSFNEWQKVKLEDVVGFNPSERLQKGVVAKKVAMECLTPFTRKISSYEITEFKGGTKFRNGDTLLARITPCLENGKTAYVDILDKDEIGFGSTEYIVLREKYKITDSKFIYYLSISPQFREIAIKSMNGSSGRQRVQNDVLKNTEILLPSLEEQKAIANVLSSLDDKIELNNQVNETLEEMAQALFKRWFVDFEFPNEEGQPYKSSGGEMIESELGMIPKGWSINILDDYCTEITRGQTPKYVESSNLLVLNQKVNKGKSLEKQYFKYLNPDLKVPANKYCKKWDILLNSLGQGTLGRVHLYKEDSSNIVVDQHITIIRNNKLDSLYLYNLLNTSYYQGRLDSLVSGSTGMLMLNISKIRGLSILQPQKEIIVKFGSIVESYYENIANNEKINEYLINIRDTLLPKLMSGEIRVSDLDS